jgi:hypothetical protein
MTYRAGLIEPALAAFIKVMRNANNALPRIKTAAR